MGGAVRIDPVLAPMLKDAAAGIRSSIARLNETTHLVLGIMCASFAALVFFTVGVQTHPPPLEATTAHLMSCETVPRSKSTPVLKMELDAPPRDVRFELHGEDVAALREARRRHAFVNVVYRQKHAGPSCGGASHRIRWRTRDRSRGGGRPATAVERDDRRRVGRRVRRDRGRVLHRCSVGAQEQGPAGTQVSAVTAGRETPAR